jgi:hypothetical protein
MVKIVPYYPDKWSKDHPTGNIAFQHTLKGDPSSIDNFMYVLARQDADFEMPRHRHNFEQIRLPLCGDMNFTRDGVLREGEVGYFSEGVAYGPQSDPLGKTKPGERLQLVLQFGGASTYGFMSIEQRREAWAELQKTGHFEGPYYHGNDGKVQWGLNAVWEKAFGTRLKYPRSRYKGIVIADPKRFNWLHLAGAAGVEHKYLGAFSERAVWIEMVRLHADVTWTSTDPKARRLFVVLSGEGSIDGQAINRHGSIQVDPGETLRLKASANLQLFEIGLPPIEQPVAESDQFDLEEMPQQEADEAVAEVQS